MASFKNLLKLVPRGCDAINNMLLHQLLAVNKNTEFLFNILIFSPGVNQLLGIN